MKKAFTLSEVLVTLGIIGVVSAMTVPTLMRNHQRQVLVTQLQKVYSEIQQAFDMYINDRHAMDLNEAGFYSKTQIDNFVKNYLKVTSTCTSQNNLLPCFADTYSDMNGTKEAIIDESDCFSAYVLADGATICFASSGSNQIGVDINGPQGPNIAGRDFFYLGWLKDGTLDEYGIAMYNGEYNNSEDIEQQRETVYNSKCGKKGSYSVGCFGKILNDGWKMNY